MESSRSSDIRAGDEFKVQGSKFKVDEGAIAACAAAVDELKASRALITALESENASLRSRVETEKQITALLAELNETRNSESDALRKTIDAKNEAIAAKQQVIDSQEKLMANLKGRKRSVIGRLGDLLLGAAVIAVLK